MCGSHHEHRGRGFGRGFRHGFPPREQWVERLQAYQAHLEQELANVREVIERLGTVEPQQPSEI